MNQALRWITAGTLPEIPRQGARVVATPIGPVAVFRTHDDRIFALEDRCPHRGGPLSQGIVHGHAVTCPLHNWVIELASGEARRPDKGCSRVVPVSVVDEVVRIGLPARAGQASGG